MNIFLTAPKKYEKERKKKPLLSVFLTLRRSFT